ncbi:MAG: hypothetical protein DSM106950_01330 [Stigonema ocellatum SAG 48.90 = DSM 106950]|nr:hypothetical protein [Stigonema ocellatum SAG 48.90 = DSM 106950]
MGLVKIRISGNQADVEATIRFLLDTEAVMKFPQLVSRSSYYPNRDGSGLRCYIDFLIEGDYAVQDATVNPEPPVQLTQWRSNSL